MLSESGQHVMKVNQHVHDAVEHDGQVHVAVEIFWFCGDRVKEPGSWKAIRGGG